MATWQCVKNCGACCNLDPTARPELDEYLSPEQIDIYMSMVGEDGWCINLDRETRECTIYEKRPSFCRVTAETFHSMFGITAADLNDFAIDCCREQIEDVYGDRSLEMLKFDRAVGI
ncbi:YkgJ family cysteine cluster protein [filamentous cyanobacterium LEGE 11480]|uniref:YkgJ family cysteine cluster protein n=1 Tax=Romeriopsis navalis LEGE 11480 TaxID=2777977 RepID=A0A928VGZ4_9CYAN|nr:YkgJ family cysteine cluster protein [Romeriopsis navalis]MBE9028423.1 YkgJ family cysteine cluster protein [Romeriopsis navalis LEGE 11480]